MGIGDCTGYSSLGYGSTLMRQALNAEPRTALTLDARLDPQKPNEYSVQLPSPIIPPPEKPSDAKRNENRVSQNNDPVSRAFNAVASYQATQKPLIDTYV